MLSSFVHKVSSVSPKHLKRSMYNDAVSSMDLQPFNRRNEKNNKNES